MQEVQELAAWHLTAEALARFNKADERPDSKIIKTPKADAFGVF